MLAPNMEDRDIAIPAAPGVQFVARETSSSQVEPSSRKLFPETWKWLVSDSTLVSLKYNFSLFRYQT